MCVIDTVNCVSLSLLVILGRSILRNHRRQQFSISGQWSIFVGFRCNQPTHNWAKTSSSMRRSFFLIFYSGFSSPEDISANLYEPTSELINGQVVLRRWLTRRLFLSAPTVCLQATTAHSNVIGQYYSNRPVQTSASQMPKSCPGGLQILQICSFVKGKLLKENKCIVKLKCSGS